MVHGFRGAFGVGNQTGADLTVATVARDRFARYFDAEFAMAYEADEDPTSGRSETEEVFLDRVAASLDFTIEGSVEGVLTRLLKSLFGTDTITTPGGGILTRDHTITVADTLGTAGRLSFEKKVGTSSHAFIANGVVQRLRVGFDQAGQMRFAGRALCGKPQYLAAATAVTLPTAATRLSRRMGTFTLFGLADNALKVRSGFLEYERVLDEEDFTTDNLFRRDAEYGAFRARWELQVLYENADQVRRMWGSATETEPKTTPAYYDATVKYEHPTVIEGALKYGLTAKFPRSHIRVSAPLPAKDVIVQTIRGTAVYDTVTAKAADAVVRNTVTAI